MKKFSQYDLIGRELLSLECSSEQKTILDRIGSLLDYWLDGFKFSLKVPNYLYFRAKVLCEDVYDLSGYDIKVEELVYLLYRGFLQTVKEYDDPLSIYQLVFVRVSGNVTVQKKGRFFLLEEKDDSVQYLNISLKKKYVMRGEVLLRDLELIIPDHGLTVELILETLFIDFMKEYQKGNTRKTIANLIEIGRAHV